MRAVTPKKDLSKHLQDMLTSVMKPRGRKVHPPQTETVRLLRQTEKKVTVKLRLISLQLISAPSGALECTFYSRFHIKPKLIREFIDTW